MTVEQFVTALNKVIEEKGVTLAYTSHGKQFEGTVTEAVHDTANDTVLLQWCSFKGAPQLPYLVVPGDEVYEKLKEKL